MSYFAPETDPRLYRCSCERPDCDAPAVSDTLVSLLNELRRRVDRPIRVTSGPRCAVWNETVGGARTSDHLFGEGADLAAPTSGERDQLLAAVYAPPRLFWRVGIGAAFVHVGLPGHERLARLTWTYYSQLQR